MGPVIRNVIRDCIRPVMGDEALVSRFSPAASDYIKRLDAAGLRVSIYDRANARLIDRLVANGGNFWPDSGAFNAMAGYLYPGNGADLIPLKDGHDAGTLFNFVTGDWNAVTGLKGDERTKYVDSNRNNNSDGQNDQAMGAYATAEQIAGSGVLMGSGGTGTGANNIIISNPSNVFGIRNRNLNFDTVGTAAGGILGLNSMSRSDSSECLTRHLGLDSTITRTSETPSTGSVFVFSRENGSGAADAHTNARLPFYHIGPNLNGTGELAELDAILTDWQIDLANA